MSFARWEDGVETDRPRTYGGKVWLLVGLAIALVALLLALAGCAALSEVAAPLLSPEAALAATPTPQALPPIPDAVYGAKGDVRYVQIPVPDCVNVTATPIVVNGWLIYPMHTQQRRCTAQGPYDRTLLGYNPGDGQLYAIYEGAAGEAPLTYAPEPNALYWNVVFGGSVLRFDGRTLALQAKLGVRATSDASGVFLDGLYYYGTVNAPDPSCQRPINENCGGIYALDAQGNVVYALNLDKGFRAWIGTGLTTDGEFLYIGTAAQTVGEKSGDETEYLYGCSVVKVDKQLNVLASFDPGELACHALPFRGANMDSVAGEVPVGPNELWVQYVRPNDDPMKTALYVLERGDLKERCRVEFDFEPRTQAIGFYAAPTLDAQGNAYVAVTVPDGAATRKAQLFRVTPQCESTLLAEVPGSWAHASPTLADDRYVLFATDGLLQVLTLDGRLLKSYELASEARVLASPVIHEGHVYVLQEDATLNVIENAGVAGYGSALWPRYRRDNGGSGSLAASAVVQPPPSRDEEDDKRTQLKGAFVAVHLEVNTAQRMLLGTGRGPGFGQGAPDEAPIRRLIPPQATDPEIDDWLEPHVVYLDPGAPPRDRLFVHLPGSFGVPENSQLILQEVARQGIPAVGLRYPNRWTVIGLCRRSPDPDCSAKVRGEILDGRDRTPLVTVTPANSLRNRLVKLLLYLDARYPEEGWDRFLQGGAAGAEVAWERVIVSGHSQGGGHAAFLARSYEVARVVMFGSPGDFVGTPGNLAPWLVGPHATPSERYFGFSHRRDSGYPYHVQAWEALGLGAFGPPRGVDGADPPYGGSHMLYTDALPATRSFRDAHGAVVVDRKTPRNPDGTPLYAPVWRYLCCGPPSDPDEVSGAIRGEGTRHPQPKEG